MPVTALYAALIATLLVVLSLSVIARRRSAGQSLGHGDDRILERRMRAQGNLAEYAPIALILLLILETNGQPAWTIHALGVLLLGGRLLHAWALSQPKGSVVGRTGGMVLTITMITASALMCLRLYVAA